MEREEILFKAQFHPLIKNYLFFYGLGILFISFIGIVAIPVWILGLGFFVAHRYYLHLECIVTEKTLTYKKGSFFRTEKTILLDRIQDLTLKEGPLLRALGLTALLIETAGQSNPQGGGDARLIGIVEAREFRNKVLAQRDYLIESMNVKISGNKEIPSAADHIELLIEIKNILRKIEKHLEK